jgi:transposase
MVSLRSLFVVGRKQIKEVTLEKLRRGESTRNVARDIQVSQSWVAQFCKQHLNELSDVNHSFGGRPHVYSAADCRACVREIIVGGLEIVHKVGNYLRKELHVGMSDSVVRRVLRKAGLKCKVNKKKPKLTLLQIKGR